MNALITVSLIIILIVEVITVAIVIAWESLPTNRTPAWLDNLYYFLIKN